MLLAFLQNVTKMLVLLYVMLTWASPGNGAAARF